MFALVILTLFTLISADNGKILATAAGAGAAGAGGLALINGANLRTTIVSTFAGGIGAAVATAANGLYTVKPGLMYCASNSPYWAARTDTTIMCLDGTLHYVPPTYTFPIEGTVRTKDGYDVQVTMEVTSAASIDDLHKNVPRLMDKCSHTDKSTMECLIEHTILICLDKFMFKEVDSTQIQLNNFEDSLKRPFDKCLQEKASPFKIRNIYMGLVLPEHITKAFATKPEAHDESSEPSSSQHPSPKRPLWTPTLKKTNTFLRSLIPMGWFPIALMVITIIVMFMMQCVCTLLCFHKQAPARQEIPQQASPQQTLPPPPPQQITLSLSEDQIRQIRHA
jgi:hypothetical protein